MTSRHTSSLSTRRPTPCPSIFSATSPPNLCTLPSPTPGVALDAWHPQYETLDIHPSPILCPTCCSSCLAFYLLTFRFLLQFMNRSPSLALSLCCARTHIHTQETCIRCVVIIWPYGKICYLHTELFTRFTIVSNYYLV